METMRNSARDGKKGREAVSMFFSPSQSIDVNTSKKKKKEKKRQIVTLQRNHKAHSVEDFPWMKIYSFILMTLKTSHVDAE